MALKELYQAFTGRTDFLYQVAGGCLMAAKDIIEEDPGTTNHANRVIWAEEAQENPKAKAREMLTKVIENATMAADVEGAVDNDVQFVVNSLIDTFATGV